MNRKSNTPAFTVEAHDPPNEPDSGMEEQQEANTQSDQDSGDLVLSRLADRIVSAKPRFPAELLGGTPNPLTAERSSSGTSDARPVRTTRVRPPKPPQQRVYEPPVRGFD